MDPHTRGSNQKLALGLMAAAVLVLIVIAAVPSWRQQAIDSWNYLMAPAEVKAMAFIIGNPADPELAEVGFGFLARKHFEGYVIQDIAKSGNRTYAILRDGTGTDNVYDVSKATPHALTQDVSGNPKVAITASRDGAYVAWSELAPAEAGEDPNQFDLSRYTLFAIRTEGGEAISLGSGANPHFMSEASLFHTGADGFTVRDLASGRASSLKDASVERIPRVPYLSPDGLLVLPNQLIRQYDVFALTDEPSIGLSYVGSVPVTAITAVALVDADRNITGMAENTDDAMTVAQYDLDSKSLRTTFVFPEGVTILHLVHP